MMDFISIPLVTAIVIAGIYGLFELFVRRKERLAIIEKVSDKLDVSAFAGKLRLPNYTSKSSYLSLKLGCLMAGIGAGIMVGFIINMILVSRNVLYNEHWFRNDLVGAAYGASILLFGGIGLLIAFLVELKIDKKRSKDSE